MRMIAAFAVLGLFGCASTGPSAGVPLRAGAAKVKITPEKMGWMTGYGNRNHRADGVKTDQVIQEILSKTPEGKA